MSPDDRDEECESHHLKSRFHNSLELVYDFLTLGESMKQILSLIHI